MATGSGVRDHTNRRWRDGRVERLCATSNYRRFAAPSYAAMVVRLTSSAIDHASV